MMQLRAKAGDSCMTLQGHKPCPQWLAIVYVLTTTSLCTRLYLLQLKSTGHGLRHPVQAQVAANKHYPDQFSDTQWLPGASSYMQLKNQPHVCQSVASAKVEGFPERPKLMIIVAETADRKGRTETGYVVDNFQQYARHHGYMFTYHSYHPSARWGVFMTKWADLFQYWHTAEWLLLVDSDTIVANLTNSITPLLERPEHVILQLRPRSREVDAAAVAFRTTDFSKCFLQRWLSIFEQTVQQKWYMNNDNGPLLQVLLEFLNPFLAKSCITNYTTYDNFRVCFEGVFPLLPVAHEIWPIKVFMPLTGFLREHIGASSVVHPPVTTACTQKNVEKVLMERCWSNDLLISGWKRIGAEMWASTVASQGEEGNATLAKCQWNTPAEELFVAQHMCYVEYPGCYDTDGKNLCKHNPPCSDIASPVNMKVRAEIGFGINHLDISDPEWKPVWANHMQCV